jgi:preprotein translocase subunit SecD
MKKLIASLVRFVYYLEKKLSWLGKRITSPIWWSLKKIFVPQSKVGWDLRILMVILAGAFGGLIFITTPWVNKGIDWTNSGIQDLSKRENLPLKAQGADQWLQKVQIPAIPSKDFVLGLDLQGGVRIVYDIDTSSVEGESVETAVQSLRQIVVDRVDALGVSEPVVSLEGTETQRRLVVELAGVSDVKEALQKIGQTPNLSFHLAREQADQEQIVAKNQEIIAELQQGNNARIGELKMPYYHTKPELTGKNLKKAEVIFDPQTRKPQVLLNLDDEGKDLFAELTGNNVGKVVYIVLDDEIKSGPVINERIAGGTAVISGDFSIDDSKALVEYLNAGALPLPINVVEQQTVEASLGQEALMQSLRAGLWGLILVAGFMLIYYRMLGLVAIMALVVYTIISLTLFKFFGFTMSLSGITGFILSVGFAVDGNILIFERYKEEIKSGREMTSAMNEGFKRAWTSIRDSQVSTLLTSAILFYLASGVVKGFAVTLSIGIIVGVFTSVTVSRLILARITSCKWVKKNKVMRWLMLS